MGCESDNRHQGYRPLPPVGGSRNPSRFPTTYDENGVPRIDINRYQSQNNDKKRIKELEDELAALKGTKDLPYGDRLLKFVKTFPKIKYNPYDSEKLNEIYLIGKEAGRAEIIRNIESFISIHGSGEKIGQEV